MNAYVNTVAIETDGGLSGPGERKVHRGGHQYLDNSGGDQRNVFRRFFSLPHTYSMGSVGFRCAINTEQNL